jgi:hypothetical protein
VNCCYKAAAAGQQLLDARPGEPLLRLLSTPPPKPRKTAPALVAELRGVNVHAQRVV